MLFETPDDTYSAYQRFLKKKDYRKAYRCLEKMLHEFPDDIKLLSDIVDLCLFSWNKIEIGRQWLRRLAGIRNYWLDYVLLSRAEAELEDIDRARKYLSKAKELQKKQKWRKGKENPKRVFKEIEDFIKFKEWNLIAKVSFEDSKKDNKSRENKTSIADLPPKIKAQSKPDNYQKKGAKNNGIERPVIQIPYYHIETKVEPFNEKICLSFDCTKRSNPQEIRLLLDYEYLKIQGSFDELLCLNAINGVERYWYQIETVKKVLRQFHGRALLADEVGLGKTIEAGMLIKEYLLRGMIRNVLILTPPPLVSQWREEMEVKFGIEFLTTDGIEFLNNPTGFWRHRFVIASLNTAKSSKNMPIVVEQFYDLVVVDEAHHLRNRKTLSWKLINQLKKRFLFLLTATPIQNNLIELFNLITLLKPGQFKTERQFKEEYLKKGTLKATADKEKLRGLLRDVMIRNTRSAIDLKLPKRFATTIRIEPSEIEMEIYKEINEYLKRNDFKKPMINLILREAGSSPYALRETLFNITSNSSDSRIKTILNAINGLDNISKGKSLVELLKRNPDEKKVIFTQFIKSMDYISDLLWRHEIPHVLFRGDMSTREKNISISDFKNSVPVLISTESGGEGRNLQFSNTIINFDLPWNPMRIEQRIGRLHRIGQTRDVFVFNVAVKGTIEDYIIDVLNNKINIFEMVIGEIEPILGYLGEDTDFEDIIIEIWAKSGNMEELKKGFDALGDELIKAKGHYLNVKTLDNEIFGEDYEI